MQKVEGWKTSDGRVFDNNPDAAAHERKIRFTALLKDNPVSFSQSQIDWIAENFYEINETADLSKPFLKGEIHEVSEV